MLDDTFTSVPQAIGDGPTDPFDYELACLAFTLDITPADHALIALRAMGYKPPAIASRLGLARSTVIEGLPPAIARARWLAARPPLDYVTGHLITCLAAPLRAAEDFTDYLAGKSFRAIAKTPRPGATHRRIKRVEARLEQRPDCPTCKCIRIAVDHRQQHPR